MWKTTLRRTLLVLAFLFISFFLFFIYNFYASSDIVKDNGETFQENISNVTVSKIKTISLNDIASFDWDSMYVFSPYLPIKEIENIIGIKPRYIKRTLSDEMIQLVFVNNGKIACVIQGNPFDLGFEFQFGNLNGYTEIRSKDNPHFKIDTSNEAITMFRFIIP